MKIYNSCENFKYKDSCIALGNFDGVHRGHRKIFEAASDGEWGVLLFDRNTKGRPLLTTMQEKLSIIEGLGADYTFITKFDDSFRKQTPRQFVEFLSWIGVKNVAVGYDYRFGYMARGDAELLTNLASEKGISVKIVSAVTENGIPIKSTNIRALIKAGKIAEANRLLGYNYTVCGIVERGLANGRKLGFPTANVGYEGNKLLPGDGVYCGRTKNGLCVINVGKNPTFHAERRTVEAHILDFDRDVYGERIALEFIEKIRDDITFDNINDLKNQIANDINFVRERKVK
ncbi:MAG: bifunctional riboflavin kinase/FAD synthetase [Firmicutes bacterium]|nr:bifunctional riboflavin kinase/FAD synthetase [Bacillota bacterium]